MIKIYFFNISYKLKFYNLFVYLFIYSCYILSIFSLFDTYWIIVLFHKNNFFCKYDSNSNTEELFMILKDNTMLKFSNIDLLKLEESINKKDLSLAHEVLNIVKNLII